MTTTCVSLCGRTTTVCCSGASRNCSSAGARAASTYVPGGSSIRKPPVESATPLATCCPPPFDSTSMMAPASGLCVTGGGGNTFPPPVSLRATPLIPLGKSSPELHPVTAQSKNKTDARVKQEIVDFVRMGLKCTKVVPAAQRRAGDGNHKQISETFSFLIALNHPVVK